MRERSTSEQSFMEELLTLKSLLLKGDIQGALTIVEDLEEMSRDDKINAIGSYATILIIHLIKQQAESRSTRSWDVSIRNSVFEIQRKNKRRRAGGVYLEPEELRLALEEVYPVALNAASLEVAEGRYDAAELKQLINREAILDRAFELIQLDAFAD
jgi:hypothetical protein